MSADQPTSNPEQAHAAAESAVQRRGCMGTAVSGGCGCFAFVIGAALAVALFAPQLLSGYGARVLERYLGGRIEGTVEVSGVALSWGAQQSADVRVLSPGGEQVLQGSMKFPPLLDLLGDPETEQRYSVKINRLDSTIHRDGTSTLGETFGIDAEDGVTVIRRLAERATEEVKGIRSRQPEASTRLTVRLDRALIQDVKSGRGNLEIKDSELVVWASAVDAGVILRKSRVGPEGQPGVDVTLEARFGRRAGSQEELLAAKLAAGPLSVAMLQTLGILPRTPSPPSVIDRRIERDLFDRLTPGLLGVAGAYFREGAAVEFSFGGLKSMDEEAPIESLPLMLQLKSDAGSLNLLAAVELPEAAPDSRGAATATIVGQLREDGRPAVLFELDTSIDPLVDVVSVLAPAGTLATAGGAAADPRWKGRVKSLRIPFDRRCLRLGEYGDGVFGGEAAQVVVAAALRRTEAQFELASVGSGPAVVTIVPAGPGRAEPESALSLQHRFTSVMLLGGLAGRFESQWFTAGEGGGVSFVKGSLPGDPILVAPEIIDLPDGQLELQIKGVPQALLGSFVAFPSGFASLLPERFDRIVVRELPLRYALGEDSRDPELELEVWTDRNERLAGTYVTGEFTCPEGQVDIPLSASAQEHVLKRLMPWFESIEPVRDGGQLELTMEDFIFRLEEGIEKESGRVTIDSPPLRVKLDRRLARQLRLKPSDPDGWIEWDPAPMVIELDGATTRYQSVELPLGGGEVAAMSGFETMGTYNLSASVQWRFLRDLSESKSGVASERMVAVVIDNSAGGTPRINVSPAEIATVLEGIGKLLNPDKRKELFENFGRPEARDDR